MHKLNTFCIKSRNSYANGTISLIVRYRDIESSESYTLGTARIQFADVIKSTNLSFHQQCPVATTTGEIIIGRLSVNVELGCRGLHFGADFLEAISSNAISEYTLPSSVKDYTVCSRFSEDREYLYAQKNHEQFCCDHRMTTDCVNKYIMDDFLHKTCAYDVHDDPTDEKTNSQSTPLNIGPNSRQHMNHQNMENVMDDVSNKDLTHGLNKIEEASDDMENELKGLFHIGQINYCSVSQLTTDNFVVCRPFWSNTSALVTEHYQNKTNEENYSLNYLEVWNFVHFSLKCIIQYFCIFFSYFL